jgi:sec-independent protein translocase protein TatA
MFEGLFRPTHLLIVLVIALLVFGPQRLPEFGRSLGDGVRSLKRAISGRPDPPSNSSDKEQQHRNGDAHV